MSDARPTVDEYRLMLDLYDRRWSIYVTVRQFIVQVLRDLKPEVEHIQVMYRETVHARFLFGPDVNNYLQKLATRAANLRKNNLYNDQYLLDSSRVKDIEKIRSEKHEDERWFADQITAVDHVFRRYMDLSQAGVISATEANGP